MSNYRALLLLSTLIPLAACGGADDVASPGAGTVIINNPAPTPTPTTPTPTPPPLTGTGEANFAETTVNNITVTRAEQLAVVNAGTNNTVDGTNALAANNLTPQGAAASATPFNATTFGSFFAQTSFIGAVNPSGDANYNGWTCNSSTLNFGSSSRNCTAVPTSTAAPAATACAAGTTDAGTANNYRLCRLPSVITGTLSLPQTAGVAYQMNGRVDVGVDAGTAGTLQIAAGVILVANPNDPANDFLVVNRGSTINAVGTADNPIIFTSQQNLNPTGTSDATQGQWGGVILAGRAPISNCTSGTNNADGTNAACENVVEGTGNARYGGATPGDSSGTMQFVQIRFSGIEITPGNELQGLTIAGAGSGTTLDHIQVHNSSDDGIEIFGGRSNLRYLVITGADDDGFDSDVGWRGFVQFLIVAQKLTGATSDSFSMEIDSNGNEDALPRQKGTLSNFTFIQREAAAAGAIRLRGGADFIFANGIIKAVGPCLNIVAGTDANGGKSTIRPVNTAVQDEGPPVFRSVYFACNGR